MLDGKLKTLMMHRKGATRAFPPNHPLIPVDYQLTGTLSFLWVLPAFYTIATFPDNTKPIFKQTICQVSAISSKVDVFNSKLWFS